MLRGMILTLVLLLITLSAAHLGGDAELQDVLRLARTPKPEPSQAAEVSPAPSASGAPSGPSSQEESSPSPRFMLDEPLESSPLLPSESSAASGVIYAASSGREAAPTPPSPASHLDPSAQARVSSSAGGSSEEYAVRVPTEEEARAAAQPYVKELYELTSRSIEQLSEMERLAMADYLSTPPEQRAAALPELAERYLPQITALEQAADAEAERVFNRMTAALAAIGAQGDIATEARRAYSEEKAQQLQRYLALFAGATQPTVPRTARGSDAPSAAA